MKLFILILLMNLFVSINNVYCITSRAFISHEQCLDLFDTPDKFSIPYVPNSSNTYEPESQHKVINYNRHNKPVVVYIAFDSDEPMMKIAVDKEVSELKQTCLPNIGSNWIYIIGSQFNRSHPKTEICNDGSLSEIIFPSNFFNSFESTLLINTQKSLNNLKNSEIWSSIPISEPYFFKSLWDYIHISLFPYKKYYYFIQTKSHGSFMNPIIIFNKEKVAKIAKKQYSQYVLQNKNFIPENITDKVLGSGDLKQFYYLLNQEVNHLGLTEDDLNLNCVKGCIDSISKFNLSDVYSFDFNLFHKFIDDPKTKMLEVEPWNINSILISTMLQESCNSKSTFESKMDEYEKYNPLIGVVLSYFRPKGVVSYHNFSWYEVKNILSSSVNLYKYLLERFSQIQGKFPIDDLLNEADKFIFENDLRSFSNFLKSKPMAQLYLFNSPDNAGSNSIFDLLRYHQNIEFINYIFENSKHFNIENLPINLISILHDYFHLIFFSKLDNNQVNYCEEKLSYFDKLLFQNMLVFTKLNIFEPVFREEKKISLAAKVVEVFNNYAIQFDRNGRCDKLLSFYIDFLKKYVNHLSKDSEYIGHSENLVDFICELKPSPFRTAVLEKMKDEHIFSETSCNLKSLEKVKFNFNKFFKI